MFRQKNSNRPGITLFELLLVMAILVAVAGIAIPTIDSMVTSRRLSESITQLKNELMEATNRESFLMSAKLELVC